MKKKENQDNLKESNPLSIHLTRKQMKAYKRMERKSYKGSLDSQVSEEVRDEFRKLRIKFIVASFIIVGLLTGIWVYFMYGVKCG